MAIYGVRKTHKKTKCVCVNKIKKANVVKPLVLVAC